MTKSLVNNERNIIQFDFFLFNPKLTVPTQRQDIQIDLFLLENKSIVQIK